MGATTVTGTILGVDNAIQVGVYVTFRLKSVGTDSAATSTIDRDAISVVTDANGQFSQTLWDNGDSGTTSVMEIRMPSGQRIDVIIPAADATIDIWDLIENEQVGGASPQLPTNEALFLRKTGGAMTGAITTSSTFDGRDVATDGTKLDGIEALADVTDVTSVTASGALMDSELASVAAVKATTGTFLTADQTKLDGIEALAEVNDATTVLDADIGVTVAPQSHVTDTANPHSVTAVQVGVQDASGGGQVGMGASVTSGGAIGSFSSATSGGAVGDNAAATTGGAVGDSTSATDGFAGGASATAFGTGRVQLGTGTNATDSTIQFLSSGEVTATEFGYMAGAENQAAGLTSDDTTYATSAAISDAIASGTQGKQVIRSVTFPTTSDFLSIPDEATLDVGTGDFSIFFTARIDSDSGTESIIYKFNSGIGYKVQFVSGALQLILNDGVEDVYSMATGMNDGKWHVYVITVDRSGNATAYIDNVAQTPVDVTSSALTLDNSGQVQIGLNASADPLNSGAMASYVGLTKDLITAAEIEDSSFDATRLKDLSDLSLCVDMSNHNKDDVKDRSSNAHAITVVGSPTYNDDRGSNIIEFTATEPDGHAFEIIADAAGHGDIKALDIDYITGAIGAGEGEGVILINIDESLATGGEVFALEVLTTTIGSDVVIAVKTGVGVDIISQDSGVFGNLDSVLNKAVDVTAALASGGAGNITMLVADNDTITVGDAGEFAELEVVIDTGASQNVQPTWEYSDGASSWAAFTPTDGTNGFQNTGAILWNADDLVGWIANSTGRFEVRITRTRNALSTAPIVDVIQFADPDIYSWDKNGKVTIDTLSVLSIPAYVDDTAAGVGGLVAGDVFQHDGTGGTTAGNLMVKQ